MALAGLGNVTAVHGDWREVLPLLAPFELVFIDGGGPETKTDPGVIDLGMRGTIFVLDDLTPGYSGPDPVRDLLARQRTVGRGRDPDDTDDCSDRRDPPVGTDPFGVCPDRLISLSVSNGV